MSFVSNILFLLTLAIPTLGLVALLTNPKHEHDCRVTQAILCLVMGTACGLLWAITA